MTIAHADDQLDFAITVQVGQQRRRGRPVEHLARDDLAPVTFTSSPARYDLPWLLFWGRFLGDESCSLG